MIKLTDIELYFKDNGYPPFDIKIDDQVSFPALKAEKMVTEIIRTLRQNPGQKGFIFFFKYLEKYYWMVRSKS